MSNFVQFPESHYDRAAFAGFAPTRDFTLDNARAMMWFAQLAYEVGTSATDAVAAKIDHIRARWGFARPVTAFRARETTLGTTYDTTGLFGEQDKAVVLAFAGTDPGVWRTVATDLGILIDPTTNTHRGFQAASGAAAVIASVDAAIALSRTSGKPLFITGHSLGAALGILAALRAAREKQVPPHAVYGYGTPRVGNDRFQRDYNACPAGSDLRLGMVTYRLVHGRDVVARVPMFTGYRHVGHMLRCDSNAKFDGAGLSMEETDDPGFSAAIVEEIRHAIRARGVLGFFKSIFSRPPATRQELAAALFASLPPPGHGPLGEWLRLLPPLLREHLQDQYIAALTP
jgi:triacylglycerol lipase